MAFVKQNAVVVGTGFIGPVHVEGLRRAGVHVAGIVGSSPDRSRAAAEELGLPRGYATLAVSQDGCTVYAFGGICNSNCCNTLSVLDVPSWTWTSPSCTGANLGICFSLEVAVPSRKHKSWVLLKASLCQFLVRMSLFLQEIIRASDLEAHRQYGAINSGL